MTKLIESQLNFIFERLGFHPARRAMKSQFKRSFPKGKKEMFADIITLAASDASHGSFIEGCGESCVHLGSRHIELYSVKDAVRKSNLKKFFSDLKLSTNVVLKKAYPFPITDQGVLAKIKKNQVHPMEKGVLDINGQQYQYVVLSTVTEHELEMDGSPYLNKTGQDLVKNDDVYFYYVTKEYRQLFHILYWDEAGETAILSVDRNGLSVHQSRDQLFLTKNYIEQLTIGVLGNPLNVFDAIDPLYRAADGRIVRLGHVTSDGNPVRLKLSRGQVCLKQDKYHGAGEGGGYVHAKFAVGKSWSFGLADERTVVEIDLAGKAAMLDTAQPLSDFSVLKCSRLKDLDFAIKNVRPFAV
ncbi:hypothetical protein [Vibrio alginolyticus]|uniref:hypothetical protein n=1 Tax=Vibrio alginolyticus TaxID=663 RepID=UPI003D7CBC34